MISNEQMEKLLLLREDLHQGLQVHEVFSPLTDALRNAIPFMTPEEIREKLFRTLDKLDEL